MKLAKRRKYINIRIKNKKYNSLRLIVNHKNPSDLLFLYALQLFDHIKHQRFYSKIVY